MVLQLILVGFVLIVALYFGIKLYARWASKVTDVAKGRPSKRRGSPEEKQKFPRSPPNGLTDFEARQRGYDPLEKKD